MPAATQKDGASRQARPTPTSAGSHGADVRQAKLRALYDAMGGKPCIARWDDGRTVIVSAEALKIVPITNIRVS